MQRWMIIRSWEQAWLEKERGNGNKGKKQKSGAVVKPIDHSVLNAEEINFCQKKVFSNEIWDANGTLLHIKRLPSVCRIK